MQRTIAELKNRVAELEDELVRTNRLASLGVLSSMFAHEVHNLLTPALNYSQLALNAPNNDKLTSKALNQTHVATQQIKGIADVILGFSSRGEDEGTCDLRHVVDHALQLLAGHPQKSGVTLNRDVPEGFVVAMSPVALQQVVLNLLINSLHAVRHPGGVVRILAEPVPDEVDRIRLKITDTGYGMSREFAAKALEPFSSRRDDREPAHSMAEENTGVVGAIGADRSAARSGSPAAPESAAGSASESASSSGKSRGHGLGLAVCRCLVGRAGGRIRIDSRPNLGTTVSVELRRAVSSRERKSA